MPRPATQALLAALAYATFRSEDVASATHDLVQKLDEDLTEDDYDMGDDVEEAVTQLETVMAETDSISEATNAAIAEASGDDLEDEDEISA